MSCYASSNVMKTAFDRLCLWHQQYLFKKFFNKKQTPSITTDFYRNIQFFTQFPNTNDWFEEWRQRCAVGVSIATIKMVIAYMCKNLDIPMPSVTRLSYPLGVFVSHYREELAPYLETIYFVNAPQPIYKNNNNSKVVINPFQYASASVKNEDSDESLVAACCQLAHTINFSTSVVCGEVVFFLDGHRPVFLVTRKGDYREVIDENKYLRIIYGMN